MKKKLSQKRVNIGIFYLIQPLGPSSCRLGWHLLVLINTTMILYLRLCMKNLPITYISWYQCYHVMKLCGILSWGTKNMIIIAYLDTKV